MKSISNLACKPFLLLILLGLSACHRNDDSKQFSLLSQSTTGISFKNLVQETDVFNVLSYGYLYNGGGVAIGDVNNDSLPDIYFTGNMVGSHLYINRGDLEFEEIAKEAGVFAEGLWNTGTTMADVNADGFLDIYVCRSAAKNPEKRKNLLFINNGLSEDSGQITFTEKAAEYGVDDSGYSTQGVFFDYDKDGDLDLYVLNHATQEYAGFGHITASLKKRNNPAYSDKLYRNEKGKFKDVSETAGLISNVLGFGLGIAISDLNNDGWLDLYISNDYNEQDYLYINNQDGTFSEQLENFIGHTSLFSMGSDIADINNDGYPEIMTLDMLPEGNTRQKMVSGPDNYDKYRRLVDSGFYNQTMRNMLHLNNQGMSFSEIGQFSGISNTDWSWATLFADLDNDGLKDVFITNGYKRDYTNMDFMNFAVQEKLKENKTGKQTAISELLKNMPATVEENYTYHNNGDLTFTKVNSKWGLDQKSLSNGAAYGDLDNDGDLDLVVNNLEETAFVYRNNSSSIDANHFLRLKLVGEGANTFGIGSKVTVHSGNQRLVQEVMPVRGYQSSVDYTLVFGLGNTAQVDSLTVKWPDSRELTLSEVKTDQTLVLQQEDAKKVRKIIAQDTEMIQTVNEIRGADHEDMEDSIPGTKAKQAADGNRSTGENKETVPYFKNITADSILPYRHKENNFIDFKREQLLPHKLSTEGPALAKGDVNGDGLEDVFVGGAKGYSGSLLIQSRNGSFYPANIDLEADKFSEDVDALFFDADGDSDLDLYVVSGGHEHEPDALELRDRFYINQGAGDFRKSESALPEMTTNGSSIAVGDFNGDGQPDLFIGGRSIPGQYPLAPRSFILQNNGKGKFEDVTASVNPELAQPGMVTDAVWTDFNGDGQDDLIVVGEFMPIRTFKNQDGKLIDNTETSGLQTTAGWWNQIEPGDFDGDGDTDYIVGNFGLNSQLKAGPKEPVQVYYKDFDDNGSLDPILTSYVMGESYPVFSKDDLLGQLAGLKNRYVNYSDYADQKITDIFSAEDLADADVLQAKTFASSYIENLGNGRFEVLALPAQAQFSPIHAILAEDFNGDGNLDVLLTGNFFGTRVKYGRYDANKGLLLLGDGKGNFEPLNSAESGLAINGEVRNMIIINEGTQDVMIFFAQNNDVLLTYKKLR